MSFKICTKCKISKSLDDFYVNRNLRDGLQNQCKHCTRARVKLNAETNKARTHIDIPDTKRCPRCKVVRSSEQFNKNRTSKDGLSSHCTSCMRASKYVMETEYQDLVERQSGLCAICRNQCTHNRSLSVDHDHATNKVRGLLCQKCNLGIGYFNDNPTLLNNAINYLNLHASEVTSV